MIGVSLGVTGGRAMMPVVTVAGSGYAGSVYSSTLAGQWSANGAAIAGATGTTWTMTPGYEGFAIRCGNSNAIRMAMPSDYGLIDFDARVGVTTASGKVVSWVDRTGVLTAQQTTAAYQSSYSGNAIVTASGGTQGFVLTTTPAWAYMVQRQNALNRLMTRGDSTTSSGNDIVFTAGNTLLQFIEKYTVNGDKTYSAIDGSVVVNTSPYNGLAGYIAIVGVYDSSAMPSWAVVTDGAAGLLYQATSNNVGLVGTTRRVLLAPNPAAPIANRQTIEGIMAHTYSTTDRLPASHPYKTSAPRLQ